MKEEEQEQEQEQEKKYKTALKNCIRHNTTATSLLIQAEKRRRHGPEAAQPAVGAVFDNRNGETITEGILAYICFGPGKMLGDN